MIWVRWALCVRRELLFIRLKQTLFRRELSENYPMDYPTFGIPQSSFRKLMYDIIERNMSLHFSLLPHSKPGSGSRIPVFFELPVVEKNDTPIYFGKKKCCGKFRKKGKKMCKKCPGRN